MKGTGQSAGNFLGFGDSGSPLLDASNYLIGLCFSGNKLGSANANPIGNVLDTLAVNLISTTSDEPDPVPYDFGAVARTSLEALSVTPHGAAIARFLQEHAETVNEFIHNDDHVAVAWNRNHGHGIIAMVLENLRSRSAPFPSVSNDGDDVLAALEAFGAALNKRCSKELADAAHALLPDFKWLFDRPYEEVFAATEAT